MTITFDYNTTPEEVASIIYAMWDSDSELNGSPNSQDDIKNNLRECLFEFGKDFDEYLFDVSHPDNENSFEDALLHAGKVFRELAVREATIHELEQMDENVKESYESGDAVVRIPAELTPSNEVEFKTFWIGRPDWLDQKEYELYCYKLQKDQNGAGIH